MTYTEAVEELKEMAGKRDWSLIHETNSYGDPRIQIHCYIPRAGKYGHADKSTTYQGAIDNMRDVLASQGDPAPEDEEV